MIKRFLSALILMAGFLMSACSAPPTERSVQVFDKDGKPVPHAIVLQSYGWRFGYTPNLAVTDKNGYYSFKVPHPKTYNHMYYTAYDKDGRFYSLTVSENGNNLNINRTRCNGVLYPPPPNQFDKNANPNFKIYCTQNFLNEKDKKDQSLSAIYILNTINHPKININILNQKEIIEKYIKLIKKIESQTLSNKK